jgi:integrase
MHARNGRWSLTNLDVIMPSNQRIPSYRRHRASGQAITTLNGRDVYLGKWNSPESKAEYNRIISEWTARGRQSPPQPAEDRSPLMKAVILGYLNHCIETLPDAAVGKVKDALKAIRQLYGDSRAGDFNAVSYAAVRSELIKSGLTISTVRARLAVIRRMVAWAVVREFLPEKTSYLIKALEESEPLRVGQPGVKPSRKVLPVPEEHVRAIFPHVSPIIRTMLELQLRTGMRPSETCGLTTGQIDRSGDNWIYKPTHHKTKHLGKVREITIGPRGREVLEPWLRPDDPDAPLFSPAQGYAFSHKLTGKKSRRFRPAYNKSSYATAVVRGCERAGVPVFRPNRIRHTFGTLVRKEFGLEAAQVMLGHSHTDATQVYAESNRELAGDVAARLG